MSILDSIENNLLDGNVLSIQWKIFDHLYDAGKITYNITEDNTDTNLLKQVYKDCIVAYCTDWLKGMSWSTLFGIILHDIDSLEKENLLCICKIDNYNIFVEFDESVFDNCIEYISNKFDEEYGTY